ncbi:MAG: hypothetical protein D6806_16710, partial [Deltaproteobacteria bacterium]
MKILGISAYYHDSAASLLIDGELVAAAQQERFSRMKHDSSFPVDAINYCLSEGRLTADELDSIAFYEKPYRKFDRILMEIFSVAPRGFLRFLKAVPLWLTDRLWVRGEIQNRLETRTPVYFLQHHESHAASAFGPSPFERAAVITLDGVGEWATNCIWTADGHELKPLFEITYPDSIGLLYSAFTAYCGFRVNDGEYKLMGLSPYGEPRFVETILQDVVEVFADGSYKLAPEMFSYRYKNSMTSRAFHRLFGRPPRRPNEPLTRFHADVAASIQAVTEQILLRQARFARDATGMKNLCLAGGVALNCVANGRLASENIFERTWIQPAAGDAGGAIGACYALWFRKCRPSKRAYGRDFQKGSLLGPSYSEHHMKLALEQAGIKHERLDEDELIDKAAECLSRGEVLGWFQGRMEFGPRALGSRSILADPRASKMRNLINERVKFRENFRPFAPVVRSEDAPNWFDTPCESPYMLFTGRVRGAKPAALPVGGQKVEAADMDGSSALPAVTHVDASARVQTVPSGTNPMLEKLLERFGRLTGCPVLLNTSFNEKGEPIVCSPEDAIACFGRTGLNRLVMGPFMTGHKEGQLELAVPARESTRARWGTARAALDLFAGAMGFVTLYCFSSHRMLALLALAAGAAVASLGIVAPTLRAGLQRVISTT